VTQDRPCIVLDPARCSGRPTVGVDRLPVETVVGYILAGDSVAAVADMYEISRADVLCACWYAGLYGTRMQRRILGEWAKNAHAAMWHVDYDTVPDPPRGGA
jgi:uncharacterized protein (DUF433 family)